MAAVKTALFKSPTFLKIASTIQKKPHLNRSDFQQIKSCAILISYSIAYSDKMFRIMYIIDLLFWPLPFQGIRHKVN